MRFYFIFIFFSLTANAIRVKRQDDKSDKKEETFEQELCKDKEAGEWFRLVANDGDSCRDVIQCTTSVSYRGGRKLLMISESFFFFDNFVSKFCNDLH